MTENKERILLSHGSGGGMMHKLIQEVFLASFNNPLLTTLSDAAILPGMSGNLAFTTDSFVVNPVFFPGGDIGKLAICGTINDLVAARSTPLYISAGFIIEEGFLIEDLKSIAASMATEAARAGVMIVTGDTKVVEKGKCDQVFINTSGIGMITPSNNQKIKENVIKAGDQIIITGYIGDHGMAIMAARNHLATNISFQSDCASLNHLLKGICEDPGGIKFMRDPTRGGLATTLCELAGDSGLGVHIHEDRIPVRASVQGFCDMFGFDPLHVANEGKMLIVSAPDRTAQLIDTLRKHPLGREASVIGEMDAQHPGMVKLTTNIGGTRIVNMPAGELLPRIC